MGKAVVGTTPTRSRLNKIAKLSTAGCRLCRLAREARGASTKALLSETYGHIHSVDSRARKLWRQALALVPRAACQRGGVGAWIDFV